MRRDWTKCFLLSPNMSGVCDASSTSLKPSFANGRHRRRAGGTRMWHGLGEHAAWVRCERVARQGERTGARASAYAAVRAAPTWSVEPRFIPQRPKQGSIAVDARKGCVPYVARREGQEAAWGDGAVRAHEPYAVARSSRAEGFVVWARHPEFRDDGVEKRAIDRVDGWRRARASRERDSPRCRRFGRMHAHSVAACIVQEMQQRLHLIRRQSWEARGATSRDERDDLPRVDPEAVREQEKAPEVAKVPSVSNGIHLRAEPKFARPSESDAPARERTCRPPECVVLLGGRGVKGDRDPPGSGVLQRDQGFSRETRPRGGRDGHGNAALLRVTDEHADVLPLQGVAAREDEPRRRRAKRREVVDQGEPFVCRQFPARRLAARPGAAVYTRERARFRDLPKDDERTLGVVHGAGNTSRGVKRVPNMFAGCADGTAPHSQAEESGRNLIRGHGFAESADDARVLVSGIMEFLRRVQLIQGGMGVYVSNWRLAKAVAQEVPGVTAGTVSGTGLDMVHTRLLQLGDPGGHTRRAFAALDARFGIDIGQRVAERYFIAGGKEPFQPYRYSPNYTVRAQDRSSSIPPWIPGSPPVPLSVDDELIELLIATGFAEVWLAKEGHDGLIFINFLKKIDVPLTYFLYGAMLAGVDGVAVGAGNPDSIPALCSRLARHEPVNEQVHVLYAESGETFILPFDPRSIANGRLASCELRRPAVLAIVSHQDAVRALAASPRGPPDGFIIEHHTAGGHNANPRGNMAKDDRGQPIYDDRDEAEWESIREIGLPFWLAGGAASHQRLEQARAAGASGVQVGSLFALAEESGLRPDLRASILRKLRDGADQDLVRTTTHSPTGFAFKVVQLEGTLSDAQVYEARRRVCDLGGLQQRALTKPGPDGMRQLYRRCPAEPIAVFVRKRGLEANAQDRRCLCNGLVSAIGLGQIIKKEGNWSEEPAIVTLGNDLDGVRRVSRNGQSRYYTRDVVLDLLGRGAVAPAGRSAGMSS